MFAHQSKLILLSLFVATALDANNLDEVMDGFDDEPTTSTLHSESLNGEENFMDGFDETPTLSSAKDEKGKLVGALGDFTGKLTEQLVFSYSDDSPHDNISSLKSSLLLDYEHKFSNGFKLKTNAKAYYDAIYSLRGREKYSNDELDELESEVELFDAYVEGRLSDNLDLKLGRQVVVWGRSDTIRVTDILNPLDNRRPAMVDIEDLRLPVAMAKLDYFVGDWRIAPIAILEQRFSKKAPSGGAFNANLKSLPADESYSDIAPALSVGAEFSGWDINFYAAKVHADIGYIKNSKIAHDKVNMLGSAVNILKGPWLLKSELAHFDGIKYSAIPNQDFKRTDALLGLDYNGMADTLISYDVAVRNIHDYKESIGIKERSYQHALRASSDFMNAQIKANYLLSLFGSRADEGGYQRAWLKYDIVDGIYANVGVVDYIGGSSSFDAISDNDTVFMDLTYSF